MCAIWCSKRNWKNFFKIPLFCLACPKKPAKICDFWHKFGENWVSEANITNTEILTFNDYERTFYRVSSPFYGIQKPWAIFKAAWVKVALAAAIGSVSDSEICLVFRGLP